MMFTIPARRGFTLIELLIVVAILAVLAGLLLPAIASARRSANRVACANSLRQWGVALMAYSADFRELIPRTPGYDWPAAAIWNWDQPTSGWPSGFYDQMALDKMLPYLQGGAVFDKVTKVWTLNPIYTCRSNPGMGKRTAWNNTGSAFMSYAYYGWVDAWAGGSRTTQARGDLTERRLDANRLIMADAVVDKRNHGSPQPGIAMTNHGRGTPGAMPFSALAGTNRLMGDGSVTWKNDFDRDGMEAMTAQNRIFGWGDRYWY